MIFGPIKLNQIKKPLKGLPKSAAEHAFLTMSILVFIAFIIGGLMFYKYSMISPKAEPEITEELFQFKETLYQKILDEWQVREKRFEEVDKKKSSDPFR